MGAEVAAFYNNRLIMEPDDHPPLLYTSSLVHEWGHALQDLGFFRIGLVLPGSQIRSSTINMSEERRLLLSELLTTDQPVGNDWQQEVQQTALDLMKKLTIGMIEPDSILVDASMKRQDFDMFVKVIMGINTHLGTSLSPNVVDPHYFTYETPGYYVERACATILRNSLGLSGQEFSNLYEIKSASATHRAANQEALDLLRRDELPII